MPRAKTPARANGKPAPAPFPSTPLDAPARPARQATRYTYEQFQRTILNRLSADAKDAGTIVRSFEQEGLRGLGISVSLANGQRFLLEVLTED